MCVRMFIVQLNSLVIFKMELSKRMLVQKFAEEENI